MVAHSFDWKQYVINYPELADVVTDVSSGLKHFARYGRDEGKTDKPLIIVEPVVPEIVSEPEVVPEPEVVAPITVEDLPEVIEVTELPSTQPIEKEYEEEQELSEEDYSESELEKSSSLVNMAGLLEQSGDSGVELVFGDASTPKPKRGRKKKVVA